MAAGDIGVVYTARGSNVGSGPPDWRARFPRFVESYLKYSSGIAHQLYIFYKEFSTEEELQWALGQFAGLGAEHILGHLDDKTTAGCTGICGDVRESIICPPSFRLPRTFLAAHCGQYLGGR